MRYLFLILALFSLSCLADSFDRRVHTMMTPEGEMYYVGSKKLSKVDGGVKRFEYDLTYVEGRDSVTVNFTLVSANPTDVAKFSISNGQSQVEAGSVGVIYHEMSGKAYEVRSTAKVLYADLKAILSGDASVAFSFTRQDGQQQNASYTPSQWKKESELYKRIFYMIKK